MSGRWRDLAGRQLPAFVGGFAVMGAEMAFARQAAPWFGSSLPVWAVLISVLLLALALGAAWGGRLSLGAGRRRAARPGADRRRRGPPAGCLAAAAAPLHGRPRRRSRRRRVRRRRAGRSRHRGRSALPPRRPHPHPGGRLGERGRRPRRPGLGPPRGSRHRRQPGRHAGDRVPAPPLAGHANHRHAAGSILPGHHPRDRPAPRPPDLPFPPARRGRRGPAPRDAAPASGRIPPARGARDPLPGRLRPRGARRHPHPAPQFTQGAALPLRPPRPHHPGRLALLPARPGPAPRLRHPAPSRADRGPGRGHPGPRPRRSPFPTPSSPGWRSIRSWSSSAAAGSPFPPPPRFTSTTAAASSTGPPATPTTSSSSTPSAAPTWRSSSPPARATSESPPCSLRAARWRSTSSRSARTKPSSEPWGAPWPACSAEVRAVPVRPGYNTMLLAWQAAAPAAIPPPACAQPAHPAQRAFVAAAIAGARPAHFNPASAPLTDDRAPVEWLTHRLAWAALFGRRPGEAR